jgi:hypothetical protein
MLHRRGHVRVSLYALALLAAASPIGGNVSRGDDNTQPIPATSQQPPEPLPDTKTDAPESVPLDADSKDSTDHIIRIDQPATGEPMDDGYDSGWISQWVPTGIIYHSYMAGPHEPRAGMFIHSNTGGGTLGDATLGGRMGFWRYGGTDPVHPEGVQVDFYGAALARLDLEHQEDLNSCDYVFGLPITYGNDVWQTKFGYAHLSSHLGDEFAISHPGALANRINYSRDSLVWGNSYYPVPACRVYGEVGWAAQCDGHARRWTTQFGTELSRPGPTCDHFSPFLAINGRVREDDDWVGDVNIQTGWLRRGILGQTLRFGFDYYNGKSDQSQFYNNSEQQVGAGVWYDF